jgi:hypothetical protein
MIEEHTKALAMIDGQLLPAADNGRLKQHLTKVRGVVASHLEEARRLRGTLGR